MRRTFLSIFVAVVSLICNNAVFAQTAQVSGQVIDPQKLAVSNADVRIVDQNTGVERRVKSNSAGYYAAPFLQPSHYKVFVQAPGFDTSVSNELILTVGQNLALNFQMRIGSAEQTVTVDGSGSTINTTDASVSTVIDRKFVENMPLNGRSFQSLILLAAGSTTNNPQVAVSSGLNGEYAINGQRTDANNLTVDGVSASGAGSTGYSSAGSAGSLGATTSLGTTQALVSIEALQEFRVQTSTYSARYGRQPGGQISFETRSGTNEWHGNVFDYLRNDVFDANNWFNNNSNPPIKKPAERQNDFGGTLGGPLSIPRVYSGRERTFYFFSYEGLRLSQPQPAQVIYVPSTQLRQNAPVSLQPVLNAYPLPNCTTASSSLCADPANGLSPFLLSTSLPSNLDASSIRIDEHFAPWLNMFFRYSTTQGSSETGATTSRSLTTSNISTYTLGGDVTFSPRLTNQFRLNYSPSQFNSTYELANYGGAQPTDILAQHGFPSGSGLIIMSLSFPSYSTSVLSGGIPGKQHQINVIDTLTRQQGSHFFSVGIDYRSIAARAQSASPELYYTYSSQQNVLANSPSLFVLAANAQYPRTTNFSAFLQDEWRVNHRLNLSLGVRWELNPPPSVTSGPDSRTINGDFNSPATLTLAPDGTPLYHSTYHNFAPRLGMAAILHDSPGHELVFRAGGGVYYDTGQQQVNVFGGGGPGNGFNSTYAASQSNAWPVKPSFWNTPPTLNTPYSTIYIPSQHLQLPYSFQWNATIEQALGANQSFSIGYVASNGKRLLRYKEYSLVALNPLFTYVIRYENGLSSSYNSLQVQYKRTLTRGLQALGSYTWSHALDYQSTDANLFAYQRGNSDFDVRNSFSAAVSYDIPTHLESKIMSALLSHWGADLRFTARGGFPVALQGNRTADPISGNYAYAGLDYLGGPVYRDSPRSPGGRVINAAAFKLPTSGQFGNAPRNFVRGFGEQETNLAIRCQFPIYERLNLQFRAEAFNLFNHPNFGFINTTYGNVLFGQATKTLASSLGGLTSLYQQGGPRSMQFALKLQF